MQVTIRQATPNDVDQIRFLFRETVTFVNSVDYTPEEISAWANCYKNVDSWVKNISEQYFLVATVDSSVVGFSSIVDNGYLDFMYVHKDFQRNGIAKKLLTEIEKYADTLPIKTIFAHVSKTARPFFETNRFIKTGEKINKVNNIEYANSVMVKVIK